MRLERIDWGVMSVFFDQRMALQDIRGSLDRDAAPRVLAEARRQGRKALKAEKGDDERDEKKKGAEAKDAKGAKKGAGDVKKGSGDAKKDGKKAATDEKKGAGDTRKDAKADQGAKEADDDKDDTEGDWLDFMLAMPRPRDKDLKRDQKINDYMRRRFEKRFTLFTPRTRRYLRRRAWRYFRTVGKADPARYIAGWQGELPKLSNHKIDRRRVAAGLDLDSADDRGARARPGRRTDV